MAVADDEDGLEEMGGDGDAAFADGGGWAFEEGAGEDVEGVGVGCEGATAASKRDQTPALTDWIWGTALERRKVARRASGDQAKSAAGARWPREKPLWR
ncbi:MAG: hypothetical protein SFV54_19170 [Bryobacteraceae bacterium]|nr:hypothetical protein [Bryobacteraceae bacterium]